MTWGSFTSLYGEEPTPGWIVGLKDVSDTEIMAGYVRARDAGLEFPPNLSKFREYCRESDWEHSRQSKPAALVLTEKPVDLGEGRYLPAPADNKTPKEHLDALRALFD